MKKKRKIQASTLSLLLRSSQQLRNTYQNLQLACNEYGYESPKATLAHEMMLDVFKEFRLTPKQFDHLVNELRTSMDRVRTQERLIMKVVLLSTARCRRNRSSRYSLATNQAKHG